MKLLKYFAFFLSAFLVISCKPENGDKLNTEEQNFKYQTEQFADVATVRYRIPGFDELSLKEKQLAYYLYQAALSGRDIYYDQNYKNNLKIRRTLEAIVETYNGNKNTDEFKNFMIYTKRVWFSNGIHHHYSNRKFESGFSKEYFTGLVKNSDSKKLPLENNQTADDLLNELTPIIFDPDIAPVKVNLTHGQDLIKTSAVNFYENVTQKEVENYYDKIKVENDSTPIWYGLNSKLVKNNGKIQERVWKIGGMYSPAIEKIVYWLEKASGVAENDYQKKVFEKLIEYYKTGDLETWNEYNILWLQDTTSRSDMVNGFIEVYDDPLGIKGSFESIVSIKDLEATKRISAIGSQAQWFEDNSPIDNKFKKKNVVGISAKVITVITECGDASPSTPIGINLPNATWIRKKFGSKSVSLGNIIHAYNKSNSGASTDEFSYTKEEADLIKKYGTITDDLHTDMHEVIGHASGQILPGVGTPKETLKNYASAIEEGRADLVALYYLPDQKLIDIGVMPDKDAYKAEYMKYIRNGLQMQLRRIKPGEDIEEAHMRNRQLISKWVYEKGKPENVIEKKMKDGKTYFVINDYQKLRILFGKLLNEIQRITSEGDYQAAKNLVEDYGVKVDQDMLKEVHERYAKLNVPPYKGFINPILKPVMEDGKITDVKVEYPESFTELMMYYAKNYSFLPNDN